jgi:eukaryotic-like serine/threonine-protein kinase
MSGASPPATAPTATSEGPQRYGRYILIDRLGAGGMAEVFRALVIGPEQFQRIVVVKRILPHLSADPNFVRMFISEATICGRLNHPNIIHVHEFGKVEDHYFIAMEYVQGRTLNSILARLASRNEFMRPTIAADIARQTCLALGYAHALTSVEGQPLGVVHRDVTPSNVMVAYAGGVKVLDFGIARSSPASCARATRTPARSRASRRTSPPSRSRWAPPWTDARTSSRRASSCTRRFAAVVSSAAPAPSRR